jgi:hypothetical protein
LAHNPQAAGAVEHPASPELNPTENIWQYLRQSYLLNRVFRDYDDVVEAPSSAWNKLTGSKRARTGDGDHLFRLKTTSRSN